MKRVLLMTLACLVATASMALAGTGDDVRFAMHAKATTSKAATVCTTWSPNGTNTPCTNYNVNYPAGVGAYTLIYMVAGQGPAVGINGVSFGIDYNGRAGAGNGVDPTFSSFTMCADGLNFPNGTDLNGNGTVEASEEFPAPRGGTRITWVTCQQTQIPAGSNNVHAIIGAFNAYAYAADFVKMTPNNNLLSGAELNVVTCDGQETALLDVFPSWAWDSLVGKVSIGLGTGYTPCGVVPVAQETTWGKIKTAYKN